MRFTAAQERHCTLHMCCKCMVRWYRRHVQISTHNLHSKKAAAFAGGCCQVSRLDNSPCSQLCIGGQLIDRLHIEVACHGLCCVVEPVVLWGQHCCDLVQGIHELDWVLCSAFMQATNTTQCSCYVCNGTALTDMCLQACKLSKAGHLPHQGWRASVLSGLRARGQEKESYC